MATWPSAWDSWVSARWRTAACCAASTPPLSALQARGSEGGVVAGGVVEDVSLGRCDGVPTATVPTEAPGTQGEGACLSRRFTASLRLHSRLRGCVGRCGPH